MRMERVLYTSALHTSIQQTFGEQRKGLQHNLMLSVFVEECLAWSGKKEESTTKDLPQMFRDVYFIQ